MRDEASEKRQRGEELGNRAEVKKVGHEGAACQTVRGTAMMALFLCMVPEMKENSSDL